MNKRLLVWCIVLVLMAALVGLIAANQRRIRLSRELVHAANRHDAPGVEALLAQGADPNTRDWNTHNGYKPFVPPWYEKPLALLMRQKPRTADPYVGPTVLMIAAHNGDDAVVMRLLRHGANVAMQGTSIFYNGNITPTPALMEAMEARHFSTACLLLNHGAPVNVRYKGQTPLMCVDQIDIAAALIAHGADVNVMSDSHETPLIYAIEVCHFPVSQFLVAKGADVNARTWDHKTPLMLAIASSDTASVNLLLDHGANLNDQDFRGATSLMQACVMQHRTPMIALLLRRGANINARDNNGRSALFLAAERKDVPLLRLLLANGADANTQDRAGRTALMVASSVQFWEKSGKWQARRAATISLLRRHGAQLADYKTTGSSGKGHSL